MLRCSHDLSALARLRKAGGLVKAPVKTRLPFCSPLRNESVTRYLLKHVTSSTPLPSNLPHPRHLSHSEAWLLWACAKHAKVLPSLPGPGCPDSDVTLPELCELADRQGVLGLLLVALQREGLLDALPAAVSGELRTTLAFLRRKSALWQFECGMVLARLKSAGLHPVVVKGAALQVTAYNEPVERSFGDIDLLFPHEEIQPAMRILEQVGYMAPVDEVAATYAALHFHHVMTKPNGFKVEVHWALERPDSPNHLDTSAFVANTTTVESKAIGSFHTPRPEYALLHLSVQNLENGFAKLSRLVDIDRLARAEGFDWSLLQMLAQSARARVVVHTSLRLCAELLDTPLPRAALQSIEASPTARWHIATLEPARVVLEQRAQNRAAVGLLIDLWCRDSTRSRLQGVGELLHGRDLALTQTGNTGSPSAALLKNSYRVAKLAAYQLFLYGRRPFIHLPHPLPEYPS